MAKLACVHVRVCVRVPLRERMKEMERGKTSCPLSTISSDYLVSLSALSTHKRTRDLFSALTPIIRKLLHLLEQCVIFNEYKSPVCVTGLQERRKCGANV